MQSVRCDACGLRALVAASKCPHCGHLFELRDSMGKLLPLAHCHDCDSYYPRQRGECCWCGTKPEGFPIKAYAWKGVGALAFVGMAWGAWIANRSSDDEAAYVQSILIEPVDSTSARVDSGEASGMLALADSSDSPLSFDSAASPDSSAPQEAVAAVPADSSPVVPGPPPPTNDPQQPPSQRESSPQTTAPPVALPKLALPPAPPQPAPEPPAGPAPSPARVAVTRDVSPTPAPVDKAPKSTASSSSKATAKSEPSITRSSPRRPAAPKRATVRWVSAVARTWAPVRASADHKGRILASVGPDTRVQLGESRGSWVRLRARGLNGWVERRSFVVRSTSRSTSRR